jgi:hypothetical protein
MHQQTHGPDQLNLAQLAPGVAFPDAADAETARGLQAAGARISVVIPTLNEAANLPHVFARIPAFVDEVVLVDGHSVDDTIAVARAIRPDIRVVLQDGRGKGNALACGFAASQGDIIVMLDADGSTDPAEIPRFVAPLLAGHDFVKGSRYLRGGGSDDITGIRSIGNRVLLALLNLLYRHALQRPLLRLQRILATLPAAHARELRRLRGRDPDHGASRAGQGVGRRGSVGRAPARAWREQPQRPAGRLARGLDDPARACSSRRQKHPGSGRLAAQLR